LRRELEEEKQRIAKQKAEMLKQMEEKKRLEAEEVKRLAEEQEAERKNAEIEAERKKVEEEKRREQFEIERKRVEEERRAKLAREEAARKKAAEEQIQKVARSRGGYFEEEQDPDAPTDEEMQRFLRNSLPHRLTAARQMGMPALPGAAAVSQMQIMLTPQQHFAVRTHLTKLNKTARLGRSGGSNEVDETMQSIELAQTLSSPVK
jgi:colicin import membrane protein